MNNSLNITTNSTLSDILFLLNANERQYNKILYSMYKLEKANNKLFSIVIAILILCFVYLVIQYVTFLNIIKLSLFFSSSSKIKFLPLISSFISLIVFYLVLFFSTFINDCYGNNSIVKILISSIIIPYVVAAVLKKITSVILVCSLKEEKLQINRISNNYIFRLNLLLKDINHVVLKENGLGAFYIFCIADFFICLIILMILFCLSVESSFLFSSNKIISFLVYNEKNVNSDFSLFIQYFLIATTVYMFNTLLNLFNYPLFNKYRQVFDSVFLLLDDKIALNNNNNNNSKSDFNIIESPERDTINSAFIKKFINFDPQSEYSFINIKASKNAETIFNFSEVKLKKYLFYILLET